MKIITTPDFANKNQLFVFAVSNQQMTELGMVHCFCRTEWSAHKADGTFIDWFTSKKAAIAAILA